jgi:uncharacterized protein (TIGR03437 family)
MRGLLILGMCALAAHAATFGKVTAMEGGASDLVLDEARSQLYLIGPAQNQVWVYSIRQGSFVGTPITTDQTPLSAALSRDGNSLYVVCYDGSALDVIDLKTLSVTAQIVLPAKPEGIAVDSNGLALITTTGSANGSNLLMLYNPSPKATAQLTSISVTPPAPVAPTFPPTAGRPFLAKHSQLAATHDGSLIAGVNLTASGTALFVYQAASQAVPLARIVAGNSTTVAISDDGTRIFCGPVLYDATTLAVLAQQSAANAPYPMTAPAGGFTSQANQGGSAFAPGPGGALYAAWNITPPFVTSSGSITQLLVNDPDNLLINLGLQLPQNLAGRMVISSDGANAYALSDSGFISLPLSTLATSPVAVPASRVALVTSDPCGVTASTSTATVAVNNQGRGSFSVSAQLYTAPTVFPPGGAAATPPSVRTTQAGGVAGLQFSFNSSASKIRGTVSPPADFLVTSSEAINIPPSIRVYQNARDSEARGQVLAIPIGPQSPALPSVVTNSSLPDMAFDQTRQRVYIANPTMNRVEIYDAKSQSFLPPVKVGQAPASLALSFDGTTLFVGNSGSESISVVNLTTMQNTGRISFPPLPFGASLAVVTPSVMAMGVNGLQFMASDGSLWKVVGNQAVIRPASKVLGATRFTPGGTQMVATPAGEYILMTTLTGMAYLFDATLDDWVTAKQVLAQITGYIGPTAAGPGGAYYVMNGELLDANLTPVNGATNNGVPSAVAAASATSYAYFTPVAATSTTAPNLTMVDARTGGSTGQFPALEGPVTQSTIIGLPGGRNIASARTMAIDSANSVAYMISESGLTIIPLSAAPAAQRPAIARGGAVNLASYQSAIAVNGLLSIFGSNLGATAQAATTPLPTLLGGTCVTLNNIPIPLFVTTPGQINAQIPPNFATGSFPLVIHSITNQTASASTTITVSKVAPAVFVDGSGNALLYHADGSQVTKSNPTTRDEPLTMYATGMGATTGATATTGMPSPSSPLATVAGVQVFFGNPSYSQAGIIVDFAGLAPGMIGVYQLNLRVPGTHLDGDALPITIRVGTVNSPTTGPVVPTAAVN